LGVVELACHCLVFHKRSNDESAKCNIAYTGVRSDSVHGAIYTLHPEHKTILDSFEGSGYTDERINLLNEGNEYTCFTYFARESHIVDNLKPYHWYKRLVALGASYLQIPDHYVSFIESMDSIEDPDVERKKENEALVENIINYRE
jgi:gamma-glutamylcyclotransferase (GGCT)/AIG2-like uncharacterized protein YtfP